MLGLFEELQRQQAVSEPIPSSALYFVLLGRPQQKGMAPPQRQQIDQVLSLLSNPVLDVLAQEDDGYVLTISPDAASKRLAALERLFVGRGVDQREVTRLWNAAWPREGEE